MGRMCHLRSGVREVVVVEVVVVVVVVVVRIVRTTKIGEVETKVEDKKRVKVVMDGRP